MNGLEVLAQGIGDGFAWIRSPLGLQIMAGLVATAFAWSGAMKLRDRVNTALALVDLGVMRTMSLRAARAAALLELALAGSIAAAALSGSGVALAAAFGAAAAVLLAFSLLLSRALRHGERFACMCFGDPADEVSARTVARTAALTIAAAAGTAAAAAGGGEPWNAAEAAVGLAAGAGWLATLALTGASRHLLAWNRDPFGISTRLNTRRLA